VATVPSSIFRTERHVQPLRLTDDAGSTGRDGVAMAGTFSRSGSLMMLARPGAIVTPERKDMHCAEAERKRKRHTLRRGGKRRPSSRGLEDEPNESM
jgi:hypothetical protein